MSDLSTGIPYRKHCVIHVVRMFHRMRVVVCGGLSWSTPVGLNLIESRARGYVETWKFIISGCRELDTKSEIKYTNHVSNRDHLFSREFGK